MGNILVWDVGSTRRLFNHADLFLLKTDASHDVSLVIEVITIGVSQAGDIGSIQTSDGDGNR